MSRSKQTLSRAILAALAVMALAVTAMGPGLAPTPAAAAVTGPELVAFTPFRAADTRNGTGVRTGAVPANGTLEVPVAGVLGVPANAAAVALTVTSVQAASAGDLTAWPCGTARPAVPLLRTIAGQSAANASVLRPGANGRICVFTQAAAHVLVDVTGYVPAGGPIALGSPVRIADTGSTLVPAGAWRSIPVAGKGGVPAGAKAVALTVTALQSSAAGRAAIVPGCGSGTPAMSTVNFAAGQQVSAAVITALSGGSVCLWTNVPARFRIDATVAFTSASTVLLPAPKRLLDTQAGAPLAAGSTREVVVTGAGVPADAGAVALNVKASNPAAAGVLSVFPCGEPRPGTSTTSYLQGRTTAAGVLVKVATGGRVCVYSSKQTHLIVDRTVAWAGAQVGPGVTKVAMAWGRSCALLPGGLVKCWGANSTGAGAAAFGGLTRATDLSASSGAFATDQEPHWCVVVDGAVRCWGENGLGQLGNGATTDSAAPVAVLGVSGATKVAASQNHTCAIIGGGAVRCWGGNDSGQLGDGSTTTRTTPVAVKNVSGATAIALSSTRSCAVVAGGAVRCWGEAAGTAQQVAGLSGVLEVTLTDQQECARSASGVRCGPSLAQLGAAIAGSSGATSAAVSSNSIRDRYYSAADFSQRFHGCFAAGGAVRCWGDNYWGAVGTGEARDLTPVSTVAGVSTATAVTTHNDAACAILAGGAVRCWGNNSQGSLGDGIPRDGSVALPVTGISGATALDTGNGHTCVVVGGAVRCWGTNNVGEVGTATVTGPGAQNTYADWLSPAPAVPGTAGATAVATGGWFHPYDDGSRSDGHTCAIVGATVRCWGSNSDGQLGTSAVGLRSATPVTVPGLSGVAAIAAGGGAWAPEDGFFNTGFGQSCALLSGGTVRCWGANQFGQLGDGTTTGRAAPKPVIGLAAATAIAVGDRHACAIVANGQVRCWGENRAGQLGNGTTTPSAKPVAVSLSGAAKKLAAGTGRTCALLSNGSVACWGAGFGALPQPVAGTSGTTALSTSCAVVAGTARCWNDGTAPIQVPGVTGVTAIATDVAEWWPRRTCALLSGGGVRCWGEDIDGRMGLGGQVSVKGL